MITDLLARKVSLQRARHSADFELDAPDATQRLRNCAPARAERKRMALIRELLEKTGRT